MKKPNQNCKCPNQKCAHHGFCEDCFKYHHKGLHTYCRAGRFERTIRIIHAKIFN